ncbi:hypothetical protein [Cryptosporangium sp. NPDC051539]|uniref:hypothetical protein n=1 Tax=Cryptosporangium sp. NPDC051539 TaxID=3363962 RepID=UPI00379DB288
MNVEHGYEGVESAAGEGTFVFAADDRVERPVWRGCRVEQCGGSRAAAPWAATGVSSVDVLRDGAAVSADQLVGGFSLPASGGCASWNSVVDIRA